MRLKNKISCAFNLLQARFFNKRFPLAVSWHLTYQCNYDCVYCGISQYAREEKLTTGEVFSTIDGLTELGTRRIHFCGGESLMRADFPSIIDYCKSKSIETGLISNGALFPAYAKKLVNLTLLRLSFDGPVEIHDKLRGKGAYDRVMLAVEAAKAERITAALNCTLTSLNLEHVGFIIEKSGELKVPVKFSPLNYVHSGNKDIAWLLPDAVLYKNKIDYIKKLAKSNRFILNSEPNLDYIALFPAGRNVPHCSAGRILCHIKPDGSVYSCERKYEGGAPNCKIAGIEKAFYSLPVINCDQCWCTGTLELNLVYALNVQALFKAATGRF